MQYTRLEYDLDQIARDGKGNIKYRVVGFTDRDRIEIEVRRQRRDGEFKTGQLWNVSPSISYYTSRDEEVEPNDIRAMENSMAALQDSIALSYDIESQFPRLEALWQEAEAIRQAETARIAAEKKAKYDADAPVGPKLAKHIIKQMKYEIKAKDGSSWDEITIHFATRGERRQEKMSVRYARAGLTLFTVGYYRVSKDKALAIIADSAIDGLKVDGINIVDPKLARFMMV